MAHVYTMLYHNGELQAHGEDLDYTLDPLGKPVFNFTLQRRDRIILHWFEDGLLKKVERYHYDGQLVFEAEDPPIERPPARTTWERVSEDEEI